MSRTKEMAAELNPITDADYFQLQSEKEWLEYVKAEEDRMYAKYGSGITFKMKLAEFLNKNNM